LDALQRNALGRESPILRSNATSNVLVVILWRSLRLGTNHVLMSFTEYARVFNGGVDAIEKS